uniref:Uncharacterized protein n=1 Tax=Glossina pallidipes TaxID=7398 RepID=A0A1A9Z792_GLOPL
MHRVYVLRAVGADEDSTYSSIRFGIERSDPADECLRHVDRLGETSPLGEMAPAGIGLKPMQCSQH